jgi:hypothetical protein
VRAHLKALVDRLGLPTIGFHGLRRTYITRRLAAGHDIALVASQVGHIDFTTTRDWYYMMEEDEQRRVAEGLRAVVLCEDVAQIAISTPLLQPTLRLLRFEDDEELAADRSGPEGA